MKKNSFQKLTEIEKHLDLINYRIYNVHFWKLIRCHIANIIFSCGNSNEPRYPKKNRFDLIKKVRWVAQSLKEKSMFSNKQPISTVVFETNRRVKLDGQDKVDPYTFFYAKEHLEEGTFEAVVDLSGGKEKFSVNDSCGTITFSVHYDLILRIIFRIAAVVVFLFVRAKPIDFIREMLVEEFGLKLNLKAIVVASVRDFLLQYYKYRKYFKLKRPNQIVIVCSYGKEGMIAAAQSLGITVVELQHGWIGAENPGYNFPYNSYVPYFPDNIHIFGDFWKQHCQFPLPSARIISVGYPYLNYVASRGCKKVSSETFAEKSVLVISQGSLKNELFHRALAWARWNPEYSFTYRLHPKEGELADFLKNSQAAENVEKLNNLHIKASNSEPIYQALMKTSCVVSVSSFTIFEALAFRVKVFVLDLDPLKRIEPLVSEGLVCLISPDQNLDFSSNTTRRPSVEEVDRMFHRFSTFWAGQSF